MNSTRRGETKSIHPNPTLIFCIGNYSKNRREINRATVAKETVEANWSCFCVSFHQKLLLLPGTFEWILLERHESIAKERYVVPEFAQLDVIYSFLSCPELLESISGRIQHIDFVPLLIMRLSSLYRDRAVNNGFENVSFCKHISAIHRQLKHTDEEDLKCRLLVNGSIRKYNFFENKNSTNPHHTIMTMCSMVVTYFLETCIILR